MQDETSAEYLQSAQPRLFMICRVDVEGGRSKLTPYISKFDRGWGEAISEGYDPDHSPLGCPVYWRIVKRGDEQVYCSTFSATRDQIMKGWGQKGLAYCDPVTGRAVVRLETSNSPGFAHWNECLHEMVQSASLGPPISMPVVGAHTRSVSLPANARSRA